MNRTKFWFTIVLLNVISIIVQAYGTFFKLYNTYKLERLQKRALKYITLDFDNFSANLLTNYEKLPLYIIRIHELMEMVYRIRNGMCPEYLQNFIVSKNNNFNLRAVDSLSVPKFNMVTYGKGSFRYSAPYYWNKLPNVLKNEISFYHFKSDVRDWRPLFMCTMQYFTDVIVLLL